MVPSGAGGPQNMHRFKTAKKGVRFSVARLLRMTEDKHVTHWRTGREREIAKVRHFERRKTRMECGGLKLPFPSQRKDFSIFMCLLKL